MTDLMDITNALTNGDVETVTSLVKEAVEQGIGAERILNEGLMPGMDIVGDRMETGEMFIPEVLMSANCMSEAVKILKPLLSEDEMSSSGRLIIGTVKGDLHDIGKNLVTMMVESTGFEVTDMGVDVPPENFIKEIREKEPKILALSALLTTTMPMLQQTIAAIEDSGLRDQIKIIVGGAPVTQEYADKIGADGYAADAGSASKLAKSLC